MASPCYYTLVLRYGTNKFYLAPRASISVSEEGDLEEITDSDTAGGKCATCGNGSLDKRTWKFKLYFDGGCDLQSAWTLFNLLNAFTTSGCTNGDLTVERTVCRETPLVYKVKKAKLRMADVNLQRVGRPRVLVMELTLDLGAWVTAGEGAVLVGA